MTVIAAANRWMASPATTTPVAWRSVSAVAMAPASVDAETRLVRSSVSATADTYADPRITTKTVVRPVGSLWSSPTRSGDAISTLMANNHSSRFHNLADQWRGLGGALLRHLGATGEGYSQTRVSDPASWDDPADIAALPPERLAQHMAELAAAQAAALSGVADQASTADLQLKLASGRTVQLRLLDNTGFGSVGMQVSIAASDSLTDAERGAVQALADGLDRALAGLGRADKAQVDLGGLLSYDRQVIAGLDLTVNNAQNNSFLKRFELHTGGDKPTVLLQGVEGEMRLSVDAATAPTAVPAAQRTEALRGLVARVDAAGQRGQANVALVEQMKSAMVQLQSAVAATTATSQAPTNTGAPDRAAAGALADFEASFSGNTWRENGAGAHQQGGSVGYQISQRTEGAPGVGVARQTVHEQLSADFKTAPGGRMLNVDSGNYSSTQVRDRSTVTALIKSLPGGGQSTSREADEQQRKTVTRFEGGRVVSRQVWPAAFG